MSVPMIAWAIRHKPTGLYLPASNEKNEPISRGFTYLEPSDRLPRLFCSEVRARKALQAWLKGQWFTSYSAGDWNGGPEPDGIDHKPIAGRRGDEMEVVRLLLQRLGPQVLRGPQ